jgi:hypothetical protein
VMGWIDGKFSGSRERPPALQPITPKTTTS